MEDLIRLQHVSKEQVVDELHKRYAQDVVYTWVGSTLLAMNPFKQLSIYGADSMKRFQKDARDPHVFAVAAHGFRRMQTFDENQAIVITGESGAGKSETMSLCLQYLSKTSAQHIDIERQIESINPILEAFGNAKTIRNDNSSRFGKYITLHYDQQHKLQSVSLQLFLLEKVRVVSHAHQESGFHILEALQGGTRTQLGKLSQCFQSFGIPFETTIVPLLTAIQTLASLSFSSVSEFQCQPASSMEECSAQLGVELKQLEHALTHKVAAGTEMVPIAAQEATKRTQDLAKHLYKSCFHNIVRLINDALGTGDTSAYHIGLLDIFGFEELQANSLEQMCINFANEHLHQLFLRELIEAEQTLLREEGILDAVPSSSAIDYVDTFSNKQNGIFALLDESLKLPNSSDALFLDLLQQHKKTNKIHGTLCFTVQHYAGDVRYNADGFLAKNRDNVPSELVSCIASSSIPFIQTMLQTKSTARKTIASKFQHQLQHLVSTLRSSSIQFIRCIKPNTVSKPNTLDQNHVEEQLIHSGILDLVRLRKHGFSYRATFAALQQEYPFVHSVDALPTFGLQASDFAIGATRIFITSHGIALLDATARREQSRVLIQSVFRRWISRTHHRPKPSPSPLTNALIFPDESIQKSTDSPVVEVPSSTSIPQKLPPLPRPSQQLLSGEPETKIDLRMDQCPLWRSPGDFAARKKLTLNRLALQQSMMVFSTTPIHTSLTRVPTGYEDQAVRSFKNLLYIMGEKTSASNQYALVRQHLSLGLEGLALADELYLQMVKQLTDNPREQSRTTGWKLLHLMCFTFQPSAVLVPYLRHWITHTASAPARLLATLSTTLHSPARSFPASKEDLLDLANLTFTDPKPRFPASPLPQPSSSSQ